MLLWINLTLHFAQFEEVLPSLSASALLTGKTFFLFLVLLCSGFSLYAVFKIPWKSVLDGLNSPTRTILTLIIFGISFIPLFWFRFGAAAWVILLLLGIAYLLNSVGLAIVAGWMSSAIKLPHKLMIPNWPKLNPWLPAGLVFITALFFSIVCFDRIPHVEDAIAQLLQARIFASGHFTAEPFLPQEFFFYGFMVDTGRWFSQYPPGHPLMLMIGVLIGAPYLINPLLGFAAVVLFYHLIKAVSGETNARWAAWLMALSPYFFFMHSGFMNHTTALLASLIGWLGLKRGEGGRKLWLILGGFGFGYCAATRPLEGALFALVGGIFLLFSFGGIKLSSFVKAIPYVLGFAAALSFYLLHNAMTTGHPLQTGYTLTWGGNGLGFGENNWGPPHRLQDGLVNTFMSIAGLNVFLYELPIPALLGIFLWGLIGGKLNRWDKAFFWAMILIPIGYSAYYFHDYCFGPRYYFVIIPMLIYFSIKGVQALYQNLREQTNARFWLIWMGVLLLAAQIIIAIPKRAEVYADDYWGVDNGPMHEVKRLHMTNAIVFIENHPWEILQTKFHHLGYIMGDAHRMLFTITSEGLDEVLRDMGIPPDSIWTAQIDRDELDARIQQWQENYQKAGNPPIDPWVEKGYTEYFSNGVVHLDPRNREPDVIFARDLKKHNSVLMAKYPDRNAYRYAFDRRSRHFKITPIGN